MKPKITLTNPTDDELNGAVAEYVAGLTISFGCIVSWRQLPNGEPEEVQDGPIPNYATSADAVLPLLEKYQVWQSIWNDNPYNGSRGCSVLVSNAFTEDLDEPKDRSGWCRADSFPRAACIALLRANGVEVIV